MFEGQYLNGKKYGKCKEYKNGKISFNGEYLNGKKHGKCQEYIYHYKFEGEYYYDIKWNGKVYKDGELIYEVNNGKGKYKEYNYKGTIIFEGEYLYGKINGKCKEYDDDGELIFEGDYLYNHK